MEHLKETTTKTPLMCGKSIGLSMKLFDWELGPHMSIPLHGALRAPTGIREKLVRFSIAR